MYMYIHSSGPGQNASKFIGVSLRDLQMKSTTSLGVYFYTTYIYTCIFWFLGGVILNHSGCTLVFSSRLRGNYIYMFKKFSGSKVQLYV